MRKELMTHQDIKEAGVEAVRLHLITDRVENIKRWKKKTNLTDDTIIEAVLEQVEIIEYITEWNKSDDALELFSDTLSKMTEIYER